jgi:hypothetical protein
MDGWMISLTLTPRELNPELRYKCDDSIRPECPSIPTPPPCLATEPNDLWQGSLGKDDPAASNVSAKYSIDGWMDDFTYPDPSRVEP